MTEASPQRDRQRDPRLNSGRRAFLIVRLGALGDIVHALPLAAALRATWPDAHVDWLVDVKHRAILDHVVGLSTIVPVDTRRMGGKTGVVPVVRRLRAGRYDVAVTCASRSRAGPTTTPSSPPGRTSSITRWRWRRRLVRLRGRRDSHCSRLRRTSSLASAASSGWARVSRSR